MRPVLAFLLLVTALAALTAAPAVAAYEKIADGDGINAYGNTQVWSHAVTEAENRLMVRRNGVVSELPVAP